MNTAALNGLVLAGGRSSRMGRDKAGVDYHGKPQGEIAYGLLSGFCEAVFLSNRAEQGDEPGHRSLPQIHDRYDDIGPLGGVLSAFGQNPDSAWLVLACDMPLVNEAVIARLVAGRNPSKQATAYRYAVGFYEPLCAIYEPGCLPALKAALADGKTGLRHILEGLSVEAISPDDERLLSSINTPEEWRGVHGNG